jgi:hypothetical protein
MFLRICRQNPLYCGDLLSPIVSPDTALPAICLKFPVFSQECLQTACVDSSEVVALGDCLNCCLAPDNGGILGTRT